MHIRNSLIQWFEQNISNISAFLIDIDGTLLNGSKPIPGAINFIDKLKELHFPFLLLTNDAIRSIDEKKDLLQAKGFNITKNDIVSCGQAISFFIKNRKLEKKSFYVMGSFGNPCYVEQANVNVCRNIIKIDTCSGIIIGELNYDWEKAINASVNYLIRNMGGLVIVPNPDSYWPTGVKDEIHVGSGSVGRFIKSITKEYGIDIELVYLGKPFSSIYNYSINLLIENYKIKNLINKKVVALGDSLQSDIKGAANMGFTSALILTGITKEHHLREHISPIPDYIFKKI